MNGQISPHWSDIFYCSGDRKEPDGGCDESVENCSVDGKLSAGMKHTELASAPNTSASLTSEEGQNFDPLIQLLCSVLWKPRVARTLDWC